MILDCFEAKGEEVLLRHNIEDDSRSVINLDEAELLNIDSHLNITRNGELVGAMSGYGEGNWSFKSNQEGIPDFVTSQPIKDFHWKYLERAEAEVAQHILNHS